MQQRTWSSRKWSIPAPAQPMQNDEGNLTPQPHNLLCQSCQRTCETLFRHRQWFHSEPNSTIQLAVDASTVITNSLLFACRPAAFHILASAVIYFPSSMYSNCLMWKEKRFSTESLQQDDIQQSSHVKLFVWGEIGLPVWGIIRNRKNGISLRFTICHRSLCWQG